MCEVVVCDTSVLLKQGDITVENTDAIVNLTNATLDQNVGISKAILDAAGDTVKQECQRLSKLPNDGFAITVAGNLNCQKIIHLINVKPQTIVTSVKNALKACDQQNMATVSFPAIGTGLHKLDAQTSIKSIIKSIEEYLTSPGLITIISKIIIVVLKLDVYAEYIKFFHNYRTNYPHFTAYGKTIELIKGDITDQSVDCILNLTNQSLNQSSGVSGAILSAAGDDVKEECRRIGMAGVDPEASIKAILNSILNYLLEALVPTLEIISIIVIQENIHKIYLKVFQEKSTEIQERQRDESILLAIAVNVQYPTTWINIGTSDLLKVQLIETSEEYKKVHTNFITTSTPGKYQVIKIERIQNVKLWQSSWIKRQAVDRKNPGKKNVRHLYHGTSCDSIENINQFGFNRIYCGPHGTAYGKGTYFAVRSNYSCDSRYSQPDSNGHKYIYQAVVITGRYCQGNSAFKEPPHIDGHNKDRYDSVVDKMNDPEMFVVFYDDYAYPEYLITFKSSS